MLAHTAHVTIIGTGPLRASGIAAYDRRGLCVECIVRWRCTSSDRFGYARLIPACVDGTDDVARFASVAAGGRLRSTPGLARRFRALDTLAARGIASGRGLWAALSLLLPA
jgi:hypothetical protein